MALLGALFSGVVVAIALFLLILQRANPDQFGQLRASMTDALAPLATVTRTPVDLVRKVGNNISSGWQATRKNKTLKMQLERARTRAAQAEELAQQVERLEGLLAMRKPERQLVASGAASTVAPSGAIRNAIISVGAHHGVRSRMPVIAPAGLAGRVTDVGWFSSRIMLLTDSSSRVPVIVQRTGWTGLAVGNGTSIDFVFDASPGTDRIRPGDRLVTTGDGGLFPPGIPVGVITDANSTPPRAQPLANPNNLGVVMVEEAWLPAPKEYLAEEDLPARDMALATAPPNETTP